MNQIPHAESHEIYKRRGDRNLALGLCLAGVVALIFLVSVVKISMGIEIQGYDHTIETLPGQPIEGKQ